jgi:Type III flagellar switch regulator (C-ring) FliN C-term
MIELRFGWLGESRRAALRALIAGEVLQWSRDWCVGHSAARVDVRAADSLPEVADVRLRGVDGQVGTLAFELQVGTEASWGMHLAALSVADESGMANSLGAESLEDLATRLLRRAGVRETVKLGDVSCARALSSECFGAYAATIEVADMAWNIVLDRRLADRLVPPEQTSASPLASRDAAMGNTSVPVSAVMTFGTVSLSAISGLRVGEILVGDRELHQPVEIRVGTRGAIATGTLKQQARKRAITLNEHDRRE